MLPYKEEEEECFLYSLDLGRIKEGLSFFGGGGLKCYCMINMKVKQNKEK